MWGFPKQYQDPYAAHALGSMTPSTATSPSSAASSISNDDQKKKRGQRARNQLVKTKLCLHFQRGNCQYGPNCTFAHSDKELQEVPDLRKTCLCKTFLEGKICWDRNCTFAHGESELRSTGHCYKTTLCIWNEKGKCLNGELCRFAHNKEELRTSSNSPVPEGVGTPPEIDAVVIPKFAALPPATEPMKVYLSSPFPAVDTVESGKDASLDLPPGLAPPRLESPHVQAQTIDKAEQVVQQAPFTNVEAHGGKPRKPPASRGPPHGGLQGGQPHGGLAIRSPPQAGGQVHSFEDAVCTLLSLGVVSNPERARHILKENSDVAAVTSVLMSLKASQVGMDVGGKSQFKEKMYEPTLYDDLGLID